MVDNPRIEQVLEIGNGLEIWHVHIDEVIEQDKNARVMDPQTFKRLTANIESDGRLESLPFCAYRNGKIEMISGHHRLRSARSANVLWIYVLVDVTEMSRSKLISKQLSHNAITGRDDLDILAQLYKEMDSLEDMIASHIDAEALGIADPLDTEKIIGIRVDFETKVIAFAFLPTQLDDFEATCARIPPDADPVYMLPMAVFDKFQRTMKSLGKECDIKSVGAIVSKMCDVADEWAKQQKITEEKVTESLSKES